MYDLTLGRDKPSAPGSVRADAPRPGSAAPHRRNGRPINRMRRGLSQDGRSTLYIADTENHVIRKLSLRDGTVTTVAGTGARGDGPDGDPLKCALARPQI